ncbi:MAG: acyl-CoA thioesterase [Acidobacteria bacterium]|nr:acyl-CoA thioesterase [Acidobacteriota bacterium]
MAPHETQLRVRYAETDQMGVVYHANYLVWMEVGRVEFFRAAGLRYRDFETNAGLHLAVAEAQARYLAPARYDDPVIVRTSMGKARPRMVTLEYEIRHGETSAPLATGFTKHVFLAAGTMRPAKLPLEYYSLFGLE